MEKLEKTAAALRRRGFGAVVFETAKEAGRPAASAAA